MTVQGVVAWLKANPWKVALVLVVAAGYSFGKDMALRDDAADRLAEKPVEGNGA